MFINFLTLGTGLRCRILHVMPRHISHWLGISKSHKKILLKSIVGIVLTDCSGHRISQFLKKKEFSQNRNNSATGHWSAK